jgi:hypothetical protein
MRKIAVLFDEEFLEPPLVRRDLCDGLQGRINLTLTHSQPCAPSNDPNSPTREEFCEKFSSTDGRQCFLVGSWLA